MTSPAPRLLLILTEFPPAVGGMQTHARHLAAHLARRGPVEVITYRVTDPVLAAEAEAFDAQAPYPVRRVLSRLAYWHNIALIEQRIEQARPDLVYASTVFYGRLARTGLPVVCRCVGNDVLRPWLGYPYRAFSHALASPALQRVLRWWLEHARHPDWVDRLFRRGRERLVRRAAPQHHAILANSGYTAGLLTAIGVAPQRIEVVSGGVDSAHFRAPTQARQSARDALHLPADAQVVLTVCRLVRKKGVEVLLDAVARLAPAFPRLRLVVVGDGPQRRAYEARALHLRLGDSVRFTGRVPHEAIAPYFWAADVFALASYENRYAGGATRDVETMGRVLCEANAAGLPVVATDTGGTPSVVRGGHNGLLVPPGDTPALAEAIARLLGDAPLAAALAAAGRERAEDEFDWRAVMARHEQAIERALAGRRLNATARPEGAARSIAAPADPGFAGPRIPLG